MEKPFLHVIVIGIEKVLYETSIIMAAQRLQRLNLYPVSIILIARSDSSSLFFIVIKLQLWANYHPTMFENWDH